MVHPFLPAKHFRRTNGRPIDLIVIHTMEASEKGTTAENVARFFHTTTKEVSAHYCIDNNSIVQCVRDVDVAFAAPGANRNGLQFEHAGFAHQTAAEWEDHFSVAMLGLSAKLAAEKVQQFNIPMHWLSPQELKQGKRGFTSHANVTEAFKLSTHTDPGKHFPVNRYLSMVQAVMGHPTGGDPSPGGPSAHPILRRGAEGEAVRHLQRLLGGLLPDGDFGPITEARVKDLQARMRLEVTGICDATIWTHVHPLLRQGDSGLAVQEIQNILPPLLADGDFGPKTAAAVQVFQQHKGLAADGIVGPETWAALLQ
jgi:peptidoglycan hydrolase-like protein with peptidoglycan-binding domain